MFESNTYILIFIIILIIIHIIILLIHIIIILIDNLYVLLYNAITEGMTGNKMDMVLFKIHRCGFFHMSLSKSII